MKIKRYKNCLITVLLVVNFLTYVGNVVYANNIDCSSEIFTEIANPLESKLNSFLDIYKNFSEKLNISHTKLEELLTTVNNGDTFRLIPITNSKECEDHWISIFSEARPEYMQYYADGKLRTRNEALNRFNACCRRTWSLDYKENEKPRSIAFIITYNDKFAGEINIGPLRDCGGILPEIGYATLESFSGKGVTSAGVQLLVNFLKYLKQEKVYTLGKIRATANVANLASNRILTKCCFTVSPKTVMEFGMEQNEYILSI